jgi:hypothetical protein
VFPLAVLCGLAQECADQRVLGEDVAFEIHAFDETNAHISPAKIAGLIEKTDDGMVMLVGVQSNQFPRALDIAALLREDGIRVTVGGFHLSGTMAMLKDTDPYVKKALNLGVSLFAGEAEGRLAQVLREVEKLTISSIIQVDTLCHKLPNFIEKSNAPE